MTDGDNADTIIAIYETVTQLRKSFDHLSKIVLTKQDAFNLVKTDELQGAVLTDHEDRLSTIESALLKLKPWHFIAILTVADLALLASVVYLG